LDELGGSYSDPTVIDPSTAAFALHHLPLLEKLEYCSATVKAIRSLIGKGITEAEKNPSAIQKQFEQDCRDAIQLHGLVIRHSSELLERPFSAFSGWL